MCVTWVWTVASLMKRATAISDKHWKRSWSPLLLRLLRRLASDRSVPRAARARLWLLLGYLAIPIDLVPDFVPVVGYADDAIVVSLVLRSVVRRAGAPVVRRHWPGTDHGLAALGRLTGLQLDEAHSTLR